MNSFREIRKAVFPVAGLGSRFLPATKAMPKELLPIINKPLIQYAAEEAVSAGITTLIFVTGRNKRAIEDHFDNNIELEMALISSGKSKEADIIKGILPEHVQCIFVRQSNPLGLGHAILCAERAVAGEPFAVLLADDFIMPEDSNVSADLIQSFRQTGKSQLSFIEVNGPNISNYGVLIPGNVEDVLGLVEKPPEHLAPSNLASIGRYVLTPEIFEILKKQKPGSGGEIQLADAINEQAKSGNVLAKKLNGVRFDCGSVAGYVDAIIASSKMLDKK